MVSREDQAPILEAMRQMEARIEERSADRHARTQTDVRDLTNRVLDFEQRVTRMESEAPKRAARASQSDIEIEKRLEEKIDGVAKAQASNAQIVAAALGRLAREARWGRSEEPRLNSSHT